MHWQAIRHSAGSRTNNLQVTEHNIQNIIEELLHLQNLGVSIPLGQDEALDHRQDEALEHHHLDFETPHEAHATERDQQSTSPEDCTEDEDNFLQIPIPTSSEGLTAFAYRRALRNRVKDSQLSRHGDYDKRLYTPTFIHDCLMLPGTLTSIIDKGSPEQIIDRMTPALLPGFHALVHSTTQLPCLLQSSESDDYVQGMLIFGQSKTRRDYIHRHYRPHARRMKVQVEIDVQVPVKVPEDSTGRELVQQWHLERRRIWAHAWLWSDISNFGSQFRHDLPGWTLEDYLAGKYDMDDTLRLDPTITEPRKKHRWERNEDEAEGDDEDQMDDPGWQEEPREREVVYGGPGTLEYERDEAAVGWW